MKKLSRSFYLRPTLTVAKDLLGKYLVRTYRGHRLVGKIVEVEAYLGEKDPASHAYRGLTKRNEVMFLPGGHLYVYFTYGMHYCCNVVTEEEGKGRAVLLRAVGPIEGSDEMKKLRPITLKSEHDRTLTNGPAKLCEALGIGRAENGIDLCGNEIYLIEGEAIPRSKIVSSPRVGITNAVEKKWRFYVKENPYVSRKE